MDFLILKLIEIVWNILNTLVINKLLCYFDLSIIIIKNALKRHLAIFYIFMIKGPNLNVLTRNWIDQKN